MHFQKFGSKIAFLHLGPSVAVLCCVQYHHRPELARQNFPQPRETSWFFYLSSSRQIVTQLEPELCSDLVNFNETLYEGTNGDGVSSLLVAPLLYINIIDQIELQS